MSNKDRDVRGEPNRKRPSMTTLGIVPKYRIGAFRWVDSRGQNAWQPMIVYRDGSEERLYTEHWMNTVGHVLRWSKPPGRGTGTAEPKRFKRKGQALRRAKNEVAKRLQKELKENPE